MFLAIDPQGLGAEPVDVVDRIVESLHTCGGAPVGAVRYPGERTLQIREENRRLGLPVDESVWGEIVVMGEA